MTCLRRKKQRRIYHGGRKPVSQYGELYGAKEGDRERDADRSSRIGAASVSVMRLGSKTGGL